VIDPTIFRTDGDQRVLGGALASISSTGLAAGVVSGRAFVASGGVVQRYLEMAGNLGLNDAVSINYRGQVAGSAFRATPFGLNYSVATVWDSAGHVQYIDPDLNGHYSAANDINDHGQFVGFDHFGPYDSSGFSGAALWQPDGTVQLIGTSGPNGTALGINNRGQVLAESGPDGAFVWENGVITPLSSLLPSDSGWSSLTPKAINDRGQVLGYGGLNGDPVPHFFVLTPPAQPGLIRDADFAPGNLVGWTPAGNARAVPVSSGSGFAAQLTTDSPAGLSQYIDLPSDPSSIQFTYQFQTPTGTLDVYLGGQFLETLTPASASGGFATSTVNIPANLAGTSGDLLEFHLDGPSGSQLLIGHVGIAGTVVKSDATVQVQDHYEYVFNGHRQGTTAEVFGTNGEDLGSAPVTYDTPDGLAPIHPGHYVAMGTFGGNDAYNAATGTGAIDIAKASAVLNIQGGSFDYDGNAHAATGSAAGVLGEDLSALLSFTYNGSAAAPMAAGTYSVVGHFAGNGDYAAGTTSAVTITINKVAPRLSVAAVSGTYGDTKSLSATLTGVGGAPLAGRTLSFSVNGNVVGTATTGSNGVASLPYVLKGLNPGQYSIGVGFAGAGEMNYVGTTTNSTLAIYDAPIKIQATNLSYGKDGEVFAWFTQARDLAVPSDFTVLVDWGDGTPATREAAFSFNGPFGIFNGQFGIWAFHPYARKGQAYTVTITIDTTAAFGPYGTTSVLNVPPLFQFR
jgi:hypothetical protein